MLIVSSNFSESLKMAEPEVSLEDLEDGEIESDGEAVAEPVKTEETKPDAAKPDEKEAPIDTQMNTDEYYSKSGKKKKSKSHKESKSKDKKKHKLDLADEDFAESIEKALRRAIKKDDDENNRQSDYDERKRYKKRKKNDGKDVPSKKRKKQDYNEEVDETEMMCVRGASPVHKQPQDNDYHSDDRDSYYSDSSTDSRDNKRFSRDSRTQNHNKSDRNRDRNNKNNKNDRDRDRRRGGGAHPMQDPDGVCLYFMQGKCHKGDDCMFSHNAQPPRKMELCKFYLMECCAKRDKCLYMHADFPCKYYHTGLPCIYKDECKFAHGPPLNDALKNILLKHIESAPKEILGDYPRLNREGALKMINSTQQKLMMQYQTESGETQEKAIPSLFELNIPKPQNIAEPMLSNQFTNDKYNSKKSKVRQSRWQNDDMPPNNNTSFSNNGAANVLSIKNLTGVLSPRQILDLTKMGIENLDQLGQLTVLQLNSIGISLKQITEIQLNTMSIQKLGLINSSPSEIQPSHNLETPIASNKDLDLRVPPAAIDTTQSSSISDFPGTDIDMRFHPPSEVKPSDTAGNKKQTNKDLIDIDQYTKDALKFASKEKENIDVCNENVEEENKHSLNESKDIDHRVLPFSEPEVKSVVPPTISKSQEVDTDIRFLQPEPHPKRIDRKHRRSTTDDDEDNNLLIDEKWYSSDEEKCSIKKKSPVTSPITKTSQQLMSPPPVPHVIEPSAVISKLGDLSKIDISEEVTKLLNTMKNNLHEPKTEEKVEIREDVKLKNSPRQSPDVKFDTHKSSSKRLTPRVSIYECVDGEETDGRRRTDVDLRQTAETASFGDTDLRHGTSGDIDLRLGLPFKPLPNYTPASEIDGSINSHPPIPYKLLPIHIPRPDYTDIRNSTAKSQALVDPRLRKVFRLSIEDSGSDSEKPSKPVAAASTTPTTPRVDPRRKPKETIEITSQEPKIPTLDLQVVIQNSDWYKELSTTQKIFVNQHISTVLSMIKQYQQEKTPGKKFDLSPIQGNQVLTSIFASLGVTLGENGEFSYLPKPKDPLLKTPQMFGQNSPFGVNSSMPLGPGQDSNMNMMNMGGVGQMNNMGMGNMAGYNAGYNDPRGGPAPGLLGIAPNIPHGYGGSNYPNHNYGNMPFNGNNMEMDQNFQRFPNRGRGRGGNERWGRGGRGGHRDRGRGNWKNDRH